MTWFTSDPHYWHNNVISHCNRPFASLDEMHAHMIMEWNKRVKPKEHVFVLGDFSFGGIEKTKSILAQLNGYKILIKGNHDMAAHKMLALGFDEVHENIKYTLPGGKEVFLSHFPFHPMNNYQRNSDGVVVADDVDHSQDRRYLHKRIVDDGEQWLLHGHVHCAWKQNGRQINVGVDVNDFKPVSHEQILSLIEAGKNGQKEEKD